MKKYLLILFIFTSCGITKQKEFADTSTKNIDVEEKRIYRPPGKVVNETKYNVSYKDTTIVTTNYETKTVLREIYDAKGNRTTECECEGIREDIKTMRTEIQNDISDIKNTSHQFDITPLIYAIAVLGVVLIILLIALSRMQTKATENIVNSILKR